MRPNIILIMTDQQRADTIGALGHPGAHTPHLDSLVNQGVSFTNCFVTSPVCVGSRASLFRGVYPHSTNIYSNFEPWQPNWVRWLADSGYHCVNIGKMHINPYDAGGGFHQRFVVENKDRPLFLDEHERAFYDEWDKAIKAHGQQKPSRYTRSQANPEQFMQALGCFEWELDESLHSDSFVGQTANWWLEERQADSPFFLQIGFPGPHPPYDPPARWLAKIGDIAAPFGPADDRELAGQPTMHRHLRDTMKRFNIDSVAWREHLSQAELNQLWRYYTANIALIDAQVGELLATLSRRGYADNTIVIFTSDHADAMGQHGHIQKWTMYDSVTRVPLLCRLPAGLPGSTPRGQRCHDLVQLMDVAPTVLDFAGIAVPDNWEARSLTPMLTTGNWHGDGDATAPSPRQYVYSELGRDHIQSWSEQIIMRRDNHFKMVIYPGTNEGELYALQEDPGETVNRWRDPKLQTYRDQATTEILTWSVLGTYRAHRQATPKPQAPMTIRHQ